MMPRKIKRVMSWAFLVFTLPVIVASNALSAPASLVPKELMQKAQREGPVRVIVRFADSEAAASTFDSDIMRKLRRANIARARNSVRAGLLGVAHRVHHQFDDFPLMAVQVGSDGLQTLNSLQGLVTEVVEDSLKWPLLGQSIPLVQADRAWSGDFASTPYDGSGTVIAILDTGVEKTHSFLGNILEEACFSTNDSGFGATSLCPGGVETSFAPGSAAPCSSSIFGCNHGTHVAGIAAGDGQYLPQPIFGVAKSADLMAIQVFTRFDNPAFCGSSAPCLAAFDSDIIAGLQRVYDRRTAHNFASVNLSLGGSPSTTFCDSDPMKPIIDLLRDAGIATVIASGNASFINAISSPACISTAVSVGSTGNGSFGAVVDMVSSFSNSASFLSLLAPGAVINSSVPGGGFSIFQGTSMATPHVAGAFAILKQAWPTRTISEMLSALQNTGLPVLDTRNSITKPRIQILNALQFLAPNLDHSLTVPAVNSAGSVNIAISPQDANGAGSGATPFSRTYHHAMVVTLSAPGAAGGNFFHKWQRNGVDWSTALATQVMMDQDYQLTAVYGPDITPPNTNITSAPTGTITSNNATFSWTGTDSGTPTAALQYAYRLDPLETSFSAFGATTTRNYSNLANGNYTFFVKAKDLAGNEDLSPAQTTFTVQSPSISASPGTVAAGGTVTAIWSGLGGLVMATDWIGLYSAGSADNAFIAWVYVSCTRVPSGASSSGSCPFALPSSLMTGIYELRVYKNNSFTRWTTSNAFTVQGAPPPSLTASPANVTAGGTVTAAWSGVSSPTINDWIGLYITGSAANAFIDWVYTSCTKVPGSPSSSGSCPFSLPASMTTGNYELRMNSNNSLTRIAASNAFTVQGAPPPSLTASPGNVTGGGTVTASWSAINSPTMNDWIGLYSAGSAANAFIDWVYTSCTKVPGSASSSGSCPFSLPASMTTGSYELRMNSNNSLARIAASNSFAVQGAPPPSLTANPATATAGGTITAAWSEIGNPAAMDWIGLYAPGGADNAFIHWVYTSCSKTPSSAQASGSCPFVVPSNVPTGTYELRLNSNNGFTRLATSNGLTITGLPAAQVRALQ
jgi:subtilisin